MDSSVCFFFFFFQAEDGIRDVAVTGVQTCALPILAGGEAPEYVAELKIDGLSLSIHYENGFFVRGVTRGDGFIGEDVTPNVRTIRSIPLKLRNGKRNVGGDIEIRGEVYLPRKVFERINGEREAEGQPRFANPRN